MKPKFEPNAEYQPKDFSFKNKKKVDEILARYPSNQARSAIMPLLDLAQRQVGEEGAKAKTPYGGWIPRAAMDEIADVVGQPPIKVYEVATFYSMFNLEPVGKNYIQICRTTPCWLRGSDKLSKVAKEVTGCKLGETSSDKKFTVIEVECLGACCNAPMIQINDDYYEDLDEKNFRDLLNNLKNNKEIKKGSQIGRITSHPKRDN